MAQKFLPESRYMESQLEENWKANPKVHIGKTVHVKPVEYISSTKTLIVRGMNFTGQISYSELSLYQFTCFENTLIPKFLPKVFKHCITCKIVDFSDLDKKFILSRKESMEEAVQNVKLGEIIDAALINCTKKSAFIDIGAGIEAIIPVQEVSNCRIHNVQDILSDIDYIPVKILEKSKNFENKFVCSYKQAVPPKQILAGDIVFGRVGDFVSDGTGVYVELTPNQTGILDTIGLMVIYSYEQNFYSTPDIVIGNTYSFRVHKVKESKKYPGRYDYCLRIM